MQKLAIVVVSFFILSGCAANAQTEQLIHSVVLTDNMIEVQVTSNGCTREDSFILHWRQQSVRIERVKPDNCRRMPFKTWLTFSKPEHITSVRIENMFAQ